MKVLTEYNGYELRVCDSGDGAGTLYYAASFTPMGLTAYGLSIDEADAQLKNMISLDVMLHVRNGTIKDWLVRVAELVPSGCSCGGNCPCNQNKFVEKGDTLP